ncbi:hypothetical protein Cni_G19984 [Canna indica]|uniref:Transcription repressor n=1 Tax=Canna indica TaxID=4628 RepID=A0AAQ3KSM9_9LILI|nr:hypothetical protein Cni_G19984 [Canna indica]
MSCETHHHPFFSFFSFSLQVLKASKWPQASLTYSACTRHQCMLSTSSSSSSSSSENQVMVMGKKLSLGSFLFKLRDPPRPSCYFPCSPSSPPPPSWPWPSCKQPKTDSFRGVGHKTADSADFNSAASCFSHSNSSEEDEEEELELGSFSTASTEEEEDLAAGGEDSLERVVRGLRPADRLLFRRPGDTSSILEEAKPFKDSVVLAMDSEDPYRDFRRSMEEMVAAHGLTDWKRLEALLVCYLRVNGKTTHGFIFGAFADLLVALASPSPPPSSSSSSSPSSTSFEIMEIKEDEGSETTS